MDDSYIDFAGSNIEYGQGQFIDTIKTLVYQADAGLFELLDFDNDDIFLEPLLFAYFTAQEASTPLPQILFGYIGDEFKPDTLSVFADEDGIVYLPNVGYFSTPAAKQELTLVWNRSNNTYGLERAGEPLAYNFEPIITIEGTCIEVYRSNPPLLKRLYRDNADRRVDVEVSNVASKHIQHLNKAFNLIKEHFPHYYDDILTVTKRIVAFRHEELNSFATLSAHGTAFLNANENDDEVFFIEDIVHQCGHVIFSPMTFVRQDYFRIDPETPLKNFTNQENDDRTIYVAFHGVFTEAMMSHCLNACYESGVFQGKQEHELLGRLVFILKRFMVDMENLAHDEIFTENGMLLYGIFKQILADVYRSRADVVSKFDISNQSYNFSYDNFVAANSRVD